MKRRDRAQGVAKRGGKYRKVVGGGNDIGVVHSPAMNLCEGREANTESQIARGTAIMSFEEALKIASRDERFMATVYAMNTLLIHKGIYTPKEFEQVFIEWVGKDQRKKTNSTAVHASQVSA